MSQSKLDGLKDTTFLSEDNFGMLNISDPGCFDAPNWQNSFPEIIGRSEPMKQILKQVAKVAGSDCNIMIRGESGTGKELIANSIHRLSKRAHKQFIAINCSAIPEALLESELFGHVKGAFTGAIQNRTGHLEAAAGGTLFLDEIGDMPMSLQAKLLRVLQEKQYIPVGGSQAKKADLRIVVATNVDLDKAVQEGRFRLDLYYRLHVIPLDLPALRERGNDVDELIERFLHTNNMLHRAREPVFLTEPAFEAMRHYAWPGNVRELQNVIERIVVTANAARIDVAELPPDIIVGRVEAQANQETMPGGLANSVPESLTLRRSQNLGEDQSPASFGSLPSGGINLPLFIAELENELILQALDRTENNKNQAAKLLGINRTTLVERIKKRKIGAVQKPTRNG